MAGTTSHRGYPYPTDSDDIDPAGDIENLAQALDSDVNILATTPSPALIAETAARTAADTTQQADYIARDANIAVDAFIAAGDASEQAWKKDKISIQGAYQIFSLDGFAHGEVEFPVVYGFAPIVVVNPANTFMQQMATLGPPSELNPGVTTTSFHFTCRNPNGSTMSEGIVAFNFIAIGFLP
jgi:hypothetical protein